MRKLELVEDFFISAVSLVFINKWNLSPKVNCD